MLLAFALGGCATQSACVPGPFVDAQATPPLVIPDGLNAPDRRNALRIPGAPTAGRLSTDPDRCVIEPPRFYAEAGEPNPEGLPVRPSSVAAGQAPAPMPGATRVTREVTAFLSEWASAWSRRDVDNWLRYYAADYAPTGYADAEAWRAEQRERFEVPATTRIDPNRVGVEPQPDGSARVRFVQHFGEEPDVRSVVKEMVLVPRARGSAAWRIVAERIVEVL